jgi:sulfur relay (sulfurtransferase) complex TusBCD TusD component (DsrE family)
MAKYLLIASRDPFETGDVTHYYDLAANLAREGNQVTVFLCQNGVLPARRSSRSELLARLGQAGVEILADDFALRERGIDRTKLVAGVEPASIEAVVDALEDGRKVIWH